MVGREADWNVGWRQREVETSLEHIPLPAMGFLPSFPGGDRCPMCLIFYSSNGALSPDDHFS
jgi:hypothetical protein